MDRNQLLEEFLSTIIEGGLKISSVHCEVLIMNQIRDIDDILEKTVQLNLNEKTSVTVE